MGRLRCNTCGGEYDDLGADGVPYFHACPPIMIAQVLRNGRQMEINVAELQPTDVAMVLRNGALVQSPIGEMLPDDVRQGDQLRPRPEARDENAAPGSGITERDRFTGRERAIRARGRGATVITDDRSGRVV